MYSAKRFLSLDTFILMQIYIAQDVLQSHCRLKMFPICNSYTMGSYSYEVVYSVSITNIISIYHLQSVQVASEGPDSLRLALGLILGGIQQLQYRLH